MTIYSIYKITNTINNKIYIGFSKNPENRFKQHKKQCKGSKSKLSRALLKYGKENFNITIIYQSKDRKHCLKIEKDFIEEYNSIKEGYNISIGGEGGKWDEGWTKEQKDELRKRKQEIFKGENNPFYGKKHKKETLNNMVKKRMAAGNYHNNHSKIKILYDSIVYESKTEFYNKTGIGRLALNTLILNGKASQI